MQLNETKLNQIVTAARHIASNNDRCLRAIDRAVEMLNTREWSFDRGILVVKGSKGQTYTVTSGYCHCDAMTPCCKHKVARRLLVLYFDEAFAPEPHLHICSCRLIWSCAENCDHGISANCPTCSREEFACSECHKTIEGECERHPDARQIRLTAAEMIERRLQDERLKARRAEQWLRNHSVLVKSQPKDVRYEGASI